MSASWFEDRKFHRFWSHYAAAMKWSRRHRMIYWKARASAEQFENQALVNYFQTSQMNTLYSGISTQGVSTANQYNANNNFETVEDGVDDVGEGEVVMEITDEMLNFLEKSDKHKQEMRAERMQLNLKNHKGKRKREWRAPDLKPGLQRSNEIKMLYGEHAAKIQAMETAVQLTFNRNYDYNQPKYWPNLPLRL